MSKDPLDDSVVQPFRYDAVILAGGRGSRMGGVDKGLQPWLDQPLVDHVFERLQAQSVAPQRIFISANRNVERYEARAPVVRDEISGFEGPLSGTQAALKACQSPWLLVVPCDSPRLPRSLAWHLFEALLQARRESGDLKHLAACVDIDGQMQPLTCLLSVEALGGLESFLNSGNRRARAWLQDIGVVPVPFEAKEAFVNFNTLSDLTEFG